MYRCRNCRQSLKVQDSVIKKIPHCTDKSPSELSVLYLDVDTCPRWIVQCFEQEQWRKGKILCLKCKRKLGSFDFIQKRVCQCLQHPIPVVHLLKDRIDEAEKSQNVYISGASIVPQHKQMTRPRSSDITFTSTRKDNVAFPATPNDDLIVSSSLQSNSGEEFRESEDQTREPPIDNVQSVQSSLSQSYFNLGEPDNNSLNRQENLPEQNINLHDNSLLGLQSTILEEGFDLRDFADICNNRYAVLEQQEESEDGSKLETGIDGLGNKIKRRKCEAKKDIILEEEHDIEVDLTCCICMELYYSPHRCDPCQHTFCEDCLRQVCKQTPICTKCPLCRNVINKCSFDKDLTQQIKEKYGVLYQKRRREMRKKRKTHSLPNATRRQIWRDQQGHLHSTAYRNTQMSITVCCLREISTRFAWLLVLFVVHNILFKLDNVLDLDLYAPYTVNLNMYLKKLFGKLLIFGIVYTIKKALRIMFDQCIGYMVSFVLIFSVLLDGNSWLNSLLNLAVIGSLFL